MASEAPFLNEFHCFMDEGELKNRLGSFQREKQVLYLTNSVFFKFIKFVPMGENTK